MKSTSDNPCVFLEAFFSTDCTGADLRYRCHLGENERIVLVDFEQLGEDKAVSLLSGREWSYFQRFRYPKRRREWLGGRIAAKAALLNSLEAGSCRQLTILPDTHGRPTVSGVITPNLSLSISHSSSYAVALATDGLSCGIDLQEVSDKLPALTKYFASAAELEMLPELGSQETSLTMLWAVKEAMKKSLLADQPEIFSGIEMQRIEVVAHRVWQFTCAVQGHALQTALVYDFSPYILALSRGKSN